MQIFLAYLIGGEKVYAQQDFLNEFQTSLSLPQFQWPFDIPALDPQQPGSVLTYLASFLEILLFIMGAVGILMGLRIIFIQYLSGIDKYDEESMKRSRKRLGYLAMGWIVLILGLIIVKALQKYLNINNGIL